MLESQLLVPVVDEKLAQKWVLDREQAELIDDQAEGPGCVIVFALVMSFLWVAFLSALPVDKIFDETVGAMIVWGCPLIMGGYALIHVIRKVIRGRVAYLHLCDHRAGALDVQVLGRNEQFHCSYCEVGRKRDDGTDDPNLAVIALSGWYRPSTFPTCIGGMRFHPSVLRFRHGCYRGRSGWDEGCASPTIWMEVCASSLWRHSTTLPLEEIMATREDLRPHLFESSHKTFSALVRATKQAQDAEGLLVKVHGMILATSRFGASKEAAAIRARIASELEKIYGYSTSEIKELRGASPKRTAKKK